MRACPGCDSLTHARLRGNVRRRYVTARTDQPVAVYRICESGSVGAIPRPVSPSGAVLGTWKGPYQLVQGIAISPHVN